MISSKHRLWATRGMTRAEKLDFYSMPEPNSGCWLWLGPMDRNGYGRLNIDRKMVFAHRTSWEHHVGPIPSGLFACHKCDNPGCVNPSHLFIGTNWDNTQDKMAKGRHRVPRGDSVSWAKLSSRAAAEIRESDVPIRELSKKYKVSWSTVWAVRTGRNWKQTTEG